MKIYYLFFIYYFLVRAFRLWTNIRFYITYYFFFFVYYLNSQFVQFGHFVKFFNSYINTRFTGPANLTDFELRNEISQKP